MRSVYSIPFPRSVLIHDQSPNVAMDPMNSLVYAPTSVIKLASVIEHSWNKRPSYVRPYVSLPSFPETLSFRHIFRVQKYAHPMSLSPRRKSPVSRRSSPPQNRKSPRTPTSSLVLRVYIRPHWLSNLSHPIRSRDRRSNRIPFRRRLGEEKIVSSVRSSLHYHSFHNHCH
jgi:hypothetical protein